MTRLLLVNHTTSDVLLDLVWPLHKNSPTTPCKVPVNGVLEVLGLFPTLAKAEVKSIVLSSPDYQAAYVKRLVELYDEADAVPETESPPLRNGLVELPSPPPVIELAPIGDPSPPSTHPDTLPLPSQPGTTREDGQKMIENEKRIAAAFQEAQKLSRGDGVRPAPSPMELDGDEKEPAASGTLDPGVKELLVDTIPSTRWSHERLVEHAQAKGIDTKGMSKNAILRRLRGA